MLTFRDIPEQKLDVFNELYLDASLTYKADTVALHALTKDRSATHTLGAMTVVANALLNLDEVIMKE